MNNETQGIFCLSKKTFFITSFIITIGIGIAVYGYITNSFLLTQKGYSARASDGKKPLSIRGGKPVTENEYPFYVDILFLGKGSSFRCGGSLISEQYVLTAYHCVKYMLKDPVSTKKITKEGVLTFLIGVHDYKEDDRSVRGHYYGIQRYKDGEETTDIIFPSVSKGVLIGGDSYLYPDVALIKLQVPAKNVPTVSIVPDVNSLEYKNLKIMDGLITRTIGTGLAEDYGAGDERNVKSDTLSKIDIELRNSKRPEEYKNFGLLYFENNVDGSNGCSGDSGSPVVLTRRTGQYVIGISSFGYPCSLEGSNMGYYTDVSLLSTWITAVTGVTPKQPKTIPHNYTKTYPPLKELGTYCNVLNGDGSSLENRLAAVNNCFDNYHLCYWDKVQNLCIAK